MFRSLEIDAHGDTGNTLPIPLLLNIKQSIGRKIIISPALSADPRKEACQPVVQLMLTKSEECHKFRTSMPASGDPLAT